MIVAGIVVSSNSSSFLLLFPMVVVVAVVMVPFVYVRVSVGRAVSMSAMLADIYVYGQLAATTITTSCIFILLDGFI